MFDTKITILNLDGNPAGLYAKSQTSRWAGFGVIEAAIDAEAQRWIAAGKPALTPLEVEPPDIGGPDACRRINPARRLVWSGKQAPENSP